VDRGELADVGQGRTGGRRQQRRQHRRIAEAYDIAMQPRSVRGRLQVRAGGSRRGAKQETARTGGPVVR